MVTNVDPRLELVEVALDQGDWASICEQLGSLDESGRLPPTLGIVAAVAHSEVMAHREDAASADSQVAGELAMRCVANLCGVPEASPIARVVAKRLLRKIPRATGRPIGTSVAPEAARSVLGRLAIALLLLLVGALGGLVAARWLPRL